MRLAPDDERRLQELANQLRAVVLEMIYRAGSGHIGGSLSVAEIMTTLYFHALRIDPAQPHWEGRDRMIVSKGHCAPMLYAVLAKRGFFPMKELSTLRRLDSKLQGHPDMLKTPGVEMSTGSLGHGLSVGVGMALGARLSGRDFYAFVLLGDGETQEGQVWEAAMAGSKFKLDRLMAIIDRNGVQLDGHTSDIMPLEPFALKWKSFGWNVLETDGHRVLKIADAIEQAKEMRNGKPTVIIAHTIKGKGVSFMENTHIWHGRQISKDEYEQAIAELECSR